MDKIVLEKELEKVVEFSREFGAEKVFLFGSCVEDIDSARDIDIAVSGVKPRDFFIYYGKISMAVEDEVDLVDLDDLGEYLRRKILSKGRILYERKV